MFYKLKNLFILLALITCIIPYAQVNAKEDTYDVYPAQAPVKFTFNLSTAIPAINANIPYDLDFKGQDIYVAVIDTGVQKDHPFFQDRVVLEACFATICPNGSTQMIGSGAAAPVHYHGTHVAGIAAGYNSQIHGVAPAAKIIAINVFNAAGAAYDGDIIKALQWISSISNDYNIASVNMSLGSSTTYTSTCDDYIPALTAAIEDLRSKKIATVISAGNSYAHGMSAPACISSAVSVAATYKTSTNITNFSNVNRYTTIAAPGSSIYSSKTASTYGSASGTSMSAPFVTGAFAVYRSKFGTQDVSKVVSDFTSTTKKSLDSYTGLYIPYLTFDHLFAPPTPTTTTTTSTTTLPSTTTTLLPPSPTTTLPPVVTLPIPVTTTTILLPTTTTTVPVTTTTTSPVTTTIPTTTTTTTIPQTTTTTTTLPIPPSPTLMPVLPPRLHEISTRFKNMTQIYYRDPLNRNPKSPYKFSNIAYYNLICNGNLTYTIQVSSVSRWRVYNIPMKPSQISYCYMESISKDGVSKASSSTLYTPYSLFKFSFKKNK